jgi:signal transduction histidine kinase/CheY-like chemotaxis protein
MVSAPFLMRATGNMTGVRVLLLGAVYVAVTGSAARYGGWLSPVFIVLAFLPAVSVAMRGPRLSIVLLAFSVAIASWMFAADRLGWSDFGEPRAETHFFLAALVWYTLTSAWFLVIWVFDRNNRLAVQELERSNAELITARDEASAASHAKSAFLANMSHEIRTPLSGVLGLTELLTQTRLDEGQQELAKSISLSARSLLEIINQVLDYSKVANAEIELERVPFELERPFEEVLRCLAVTAEQKGLEMTAFLHPALPAVVRGDSFRLRQVLMNLLGNAIKFTEEGEVAVQVLPDSQSPSNGRCAILVEVADTGIGLDAAATKNLFLPFVQADETTTRRFGGTGLGLAISQHLAQRMGGRIEVESALGRGSLFRFHAVFDPAENPSQLTLRPPDGGLPSPRVLLIQPHRPHRGVLSRYLRALEVPFAVVAAPDEAPQWSDRRGDGPDVVIAEERLGAERLRELRSHLEGGPRLVLLGRMADAASGERQPPGTSRLESPILPSALLRCLWPPDTGFTARAEPAEEPRFCARVLVAEDNPVNQIVARGMLEAAGCNVVVVEDGREAVEAARKETFDLIFLDLQMPLMDGIEATERIRSGQCPGRPETRTPIIALSADLTHATRERAQLAGIDDFVAKPFSFSELVDAVARFL